MPRSAYIDTQIARLFRDYAEAFPGSAYPASRGYALHTHVTPDAERVKKLTLVFPHRVAGSYSGIPAVVVTAHIPAPMTHRARLMVRATDLINGIEETCTLRTALTERAVNHRCIDRLVAYVRRALWRVGPRQPDHYIE